VFVWRQLGRDRPAPEPEETTNLEHAPTPGKWHPLRVGKGVLKARARKLTAAQKQEMARLETLSYLSGYKTAPSLKGVTIHDEAQVLQALSLVVSAHAPEAALMDIRGKVLHTWRRSYPEARRHTPALRPPAKKYGGPKSWRRAYLYPNGDLLAIFEGWGLMKLDRDSRIQWIFPKAAHHDLFVDPAGPIYVLTRKARIVPRINKDKPVLADYITVLSSAGEPVKEIALLEAYESSAFKDALRGMRRAGDIFHTNSIQVLDGRHASRSPLFNRGNILISVLYLDSIAIIDPQTRKVVWAASRGWHLQHDPTLLDNGNILLFDNQGGDDGMSSVIEFEPLSGKWVWGFHGGPGNPFHSAECGTAQRLLNGNTLITESLNGRALEVNRKREIVWEYYNPHRAGKNNELIATLFDVVRLDPDFPTDWLRGKR
jgi:hypothetical protein